jgi:hypothetical protein
VQEFAGYGGQGQAFVFSSRQEMLVETPQVRLVLAGYQGGHVQRMA